MTQESILLETWRATGPDDEGDIVIWNDRDEAIALIPVGAEDEEDYKLLVNQKRTYALLMAAAPSIIRKLRGLVAEVERLDREGLIVTSAAYREALNPFD